MFILSFIFSKQLIVVNWGFYVKVNAVEKTKNIVKINSF